VSCSIMTSVAICVRACVFGSGFWGGGGVWQLPSTHALGTRFLGWGVPVVVEGYIYHRDDFSAKDTHVLLEMHAVHPEGGRFVCCAGAQHA
jgi:hypothetical protein